MKPYKTARVICTYQCNKNCKGCVNTTHMNGLRVPPIGLADLGRFDEVVITGGEPLLFLPQLIDLCDKLQDSRLILYTSVPDYRYLQVVAILFAGITITLHDNADAKRFNHDFPHYFEGFNAVQFFIRVYDSVTTEVKLFDNCQYKICKWVAPEECKLPPNEELFRLREMWV